MTLSTEKPLKTHQDCDQCGHKGCLTVWEDKAFCHSECGTIYFNKKYEKEEEEELFNTANEKSISYRSIPLEVAEKYGIKTGVEDGKEVYRKYPYPHANKYRVLPKDFSKNFGFKNSRLFGMDKFNAGTSKHITIVEGEDDAAAAYHMLGEKFPVVSLPTSSVSDLLLRDCHSYLNSFKEIVVCTDGDAAGEKAANRLAATFPNKVSRVSLTKHKDACDFLKNGDTKDFLFAWHNRKKYVPSGVYNTQDQFKDILSSEESNVYLETPYDELNDVVKGLMQGHLTVLTGPEGQGKTEFLRSLEYHILKNHPETPIASLHMEESKKTNLLSLACYELKKNVRDPDHTVPDKEIEGAIKELTENENLFLFDFMQDEDPIVILDKVRYFTEACGCKYIFIDPIQQLSYGKDSDMTEEQVLSRIAVQLERLATELDVGIVITSHVNDDGQTRSSRMIGKSASVRIDLYRDHLNPDPDVRNVTKLTVSKNRPVGRTGYGGTLLFDTDTFTIGEMV